MAPENFQQVSVDQVHIYSPFWSAMQKRARETTVPALIETQKSLGHWDCLTWGEGHPVDLHPFWDSDIYKSVEAACYFLQAKPDDTLMAAVEEAVDMIRGAQHSDGYINAYYTVKGMGQRWTNLRDMHELYCLGHLVEACVAYETLTSSGRLLEPVRRAIQHVDSVFGVEQGKRRGYPGHQEIEVGLLRLYDLTKEDIFLKVGSYFIYERGRRDNNGEIYFDYEAKARGGNPYTNLFAEMKPWYRDPRDYGYHQADRPFIDTTELKGHSVRAMYYCTAATDLYRVTGDARLKAALDRLWRDMVDRKMYVTGGLGAMRQWEGFGPAYFLNDTEEEGTCYTETCATFAMIIWCQRMLRLQLNAEYADIMEVGLYNGFLGGVGLDGCSFYYENPLRCYAGKPKERSRWFEVACCPPNVAKLLGLLGSLIYSYKQGVVAVHLYIESSFTLPGTDVVVSQKSGMPWAGDVEMTVQGSTALALRIPGWADGYTCSVAGKEENGYLHIPAAAVVGQTVKLHFGMRTRKVYAHPRTGKDEVCIMRGPLVYCMEEIDNDGVDMDNVAMVDGPIKEGEPMSIGSVSSVIPAIAEGRQLSVDVTGSPLYRSYPWKYAPEAKRLVYVPFFLRANRGGPGGMRVWARRLPVETV
ncbi:hypothetical protein N7474_001578 [Penicillium riverlandense]|uniref:uncharacterized protein n=1 Tax=Penicillium riverlandense TaxID=1903569 RepID=UPI002546DF21|nr:uncharacterized protein N7474_001578 [Penicillium riverlandense]KAJ5833267.1 hypothetical protein N7474_001578 [Penicillium riverlandense]